MFALSIDTGEILWQYEGNLDATISSVCCGWTNRGVAISEDKVFMGRLDGQLVALDRATGKPVWSIQAERWQDNFSITGAPVYVNGMVITGFAGADRGTRGRVKAYDAKDGRLVWTFYTIPGPGEPGHDTWPKDNDSWKYGGGIGVADAGGRPRARPHVFLHRQCRPGLQRRGARRRQPVCGIDRGGRRSPPENIAGTFSRCITTSGITTRSNPVILMDVNVGGRMRKAIAEVGKTGWAYILDRQTGKPLVGIDERPVPQEPRQATAATQPFPRGDAVVPQLIQIAPEGSALVNDGRIFTPFVGKDPTIVKPGIWGGANWPPSAYDPVAADAVRLCIVRRSTATPAAAIRTSWRRGQATATSAVRRRSRAPLAPASSRRSM